MCLCNLEHWRNTHQCKYSYHCGPNGTSGCTRDSGGSWGSRRACGGGINSVSSGFYCRIRFTSTSAANCFQCSWQKLLAGRGIAGCAVCACTVCSTLDQCRSMCSKYCIPAVRRVSAATFEAAGLNVGLAVHVCTASQLIVRPVVSTPTALKLVSPIRIRKGLYVSHCNPSVLTSG